MTGFLVFAGIVAAVVMLFRYWRKREVEAFLETDLSDLEEFRPMTGVQAPDDRKVVDLPRPAASEDGEEGEFQYRSRDRLFDEVHRSCYRALEEVAGAHFRIFVHVPLVDLVRADARPDQARLRGRTVSFVLCERKSLLPVCGVQLKGAGQTEVDRHAFIEDVFRQVDKPLVTLPMLTRYSTLELKESLDPVLEAAPLSRHCPKCGREMLMRKAVKGRNAGKSFWVCREFPSCKGIMRIGRF